MLPETPYHFDPSRYKNELYLSLHLHKYIIIDSSSAISCIRKKNKPLELAALIPFSNFLESKESFTYNLKLDESSKIIINKQIVKSAKL